MKNKNCNEDIQNNYTPQILMPEMSNVQNLYVFQMPETISKIEDFAPLLRVLRNATENDIIRIDINCFGGALHITNQVIENMKVTKAKINGYLYSAWSAATLIALHCDNLIVNDGSFMMIHHASYGTGTNKANNNFEYVTFENKRLEDSFKRFYKHFLTENEIKSVLSGTDIYLNNKEIEKRLKIKIEKRKKRIICYLS